MKPALLSLMMAVALSLAAQAQATVTGVVRDTAKRPLADAEVMILSPEVRVRTDSTGSFRISGLGAGTYEVRARRIGYFPALIKVVLGERTTKPLIFELPVRAVLLDTVTVTSRCGSVEFGGFLCRQKKGTRGIFMDVEQIDSATPRFPADLFRRPGWRVDAVRGGLAPVSTTGWKCMNRLVNGRPVHPSNPMPQWPNEMIGLEIYSDPDSIPSEYGRYMWGSTKSGKRLLSVPCALVIYWTTRHPNRPNPPVYPPKPPANPAKP